MILSQNGTVFHSRLLYSLIRTLMWISQSPPNFTALGLSLTHRYFPQLTGFITVSFLKRTRQSSLGNTVRESTRTHLHLAVCSLLPDRHTRPSLTETRLFLRKPHYQPLHMSVTFQSYMIIRATEPTSHDVRVLLSITITWATELRYNISMNL
jgi:hypothetical protein